MAREKAAKAKATLAGGLNPSQERRQIRSAQVASIETEKRAKAGLVPSKQGLQIIFAKLHPYLAAVHPVTPQN